MRTYGFFHCSKFHGAGEGLRPVLSQATFSFAADERIAVLADHGGGKSTLIRLLGGLERPSSGVVRRPPASPWPVGSLAAFHPALTGEENVRILAVMLDADPDEASAFVSLFAELGDLFRRPLQEYSNGMRARLGFAFSMAIPQRFYLADETIGTGDENFRLKCERMLMRRLKGAGLFLATRNARMAERFADRFAVLSAGRLLRCDTIGEARALLAEQQDQDELEMLAQGLLQS